MAHVALFGNSKTARQKFTEAQVAKAIIKSGGFISFTAKILGCAQSTVQEYLRKYPQLRDLISEIKEHQLDQSEVALFKKIQKGDNTAILFHLKCQGKKRGYIDTPINLHAELDPNSATWQQLMEATGLDDESNESGQSCAT